MELISKRKTKDNIGIITKYHGQFILGSIYKLFPDVFDAYWYSSHNNLKIEFSGFISRKTMFMDDCLSQ